MQADRRGFLRLLGGSLGLLSGTRAGDPRDGSALAVHRATRNTPLGAIGAGLPRFTAIPGRAKPYRGLPRISLPSVTDQPGLALERVFERYSPAPAFRQASLSLGELGRLLYFANGVTGRDPAGSPLRAAPSAGALYAGEVYVSAERIDGLAPGIYYYEVEEHRLVRLRSGSALPEIARATESPEALAGAASAVLLTNVFGRYTWRYANRGYRYALVDSGHIGENLRLAARSAGVAERPVLRFRDDALDGSLGIDGRQEAVCALHFLGRRADVAPPATRHRLVEAGRAVAGGAGAPGSIECYQAASRLVPARAEEGEPRRVAPLRPPEDPSGGIPLPRPAGPLAWSVERAVRERRSASRLEREALSFESLAALLNAAQGHARLRRTAGVDLYLAAQRVRGLAPGLYRVLPGARHLVSVRGGEPGARLADACLGQEKAERAAGAVLMVGRLGESVARAGERSYRDLLLESGGIGQRVYLAAESLGIAARNLAAFLDDDLNGLLGLDGRTEAVIHLTVFGPGR